MFSSIQQFQHGTASSITSSVSPTNSSISPNFSNPDYQIVQQTLPSCQNAPLIHNLNNGQIPFHVQTNGRKVFQLQPNWNGPPPSNQCELFIRRIPRNISEYSIIPHFQRFGPLFEFRLMLDFNECNRGYGFIKFCYEEDAARALYVMNNFFVQNGKKLEVQKSYDKCRLFVANIPKEMSEEILETEFRTLFPSLQAILLHRRISDRSKNRGFAFLDFPNHEEALLVKKQTTPGRLRKWGRDLKIVWANPEQIVNPDQMENVTTLFVRNIDLSVNTRDIYAILTTYLKRTEIRKISRTRELAFIDFVSKEAADIILNKLNGFTLNGYKLDVNWAIPIDTMIKVNKKMDYDAILRVKCIANYWSVPVIVFGRIFPASNIQYVAIMIRENNIPRVFLMEIETQTDIQSRACEVVISIIDYFSQLPNFNYIIKVKGDAAYIVGIINNLALVHYTKATNITEDFLLYWDEIIDLCTNVNALLQYSEEQLISMYNRCFLQANSTGIILLSGIPVVRQRLFGCILPSYRQALPLKYNLNNTEIIFALIHINTLSNVIFPANSIGHVYNFKDSDTELRNSPLKMIIIKLSSSFNAQMNKNNNSNFLAYLPSMQNMFSPIWIDGKSYKQKIYDNYSH